jgi:dihydroorotase
MTSGAVNAPRPFDLVIRGGRIVNPGGAVSGDYDLGVRNGLIAAIEEFIPRGAAASEFDASGALVLPGLVDLHTHVFAGGTFWGIDASAIAWRSGVTTWIDAGSAGALNFDAFRRTCVDQAAVRVHAFINISAIGLVAESGECAESLCDEARCGEAIEANRDVIVGVKCRIDRYNGATDGRVPLQRALAVARAHGLPVMVHIGASPPAIGDVLDRLGPGDIVTHCATGQSMALVDDHGDLIPSVRTARERGVLLDVGHGSGAFSFAVAEALIAAGAAPDVISSDSHQRSIGGPMFDLATCIAKFLALGLSLEDVVRATTCMPADAVGLGERAGRIAIGQPADVAVFEVDESDRTLYDVYLAGRPSSSLLVNRATFVDGRILVASTALATKSWAGLTAEQRACLAAGSPTRVPWPDLIGLEELPRPDLEGPVVAR